MYSLTYNSLTEIKTRQSVSKFSGSSMFKHVGEDLIKKKYRKIPFEVGGNIYKKYLSALKFCELNNIRPDVELLKNFEPYGIEKAFDIIQYKKVYSQLTEGKGKAKRKYTLNKTKVRKKISALCRLDESVKFLAFYSISFPSSAPDDILYKVFNSWLTNCRKRYNLKTYIWVAERQKNGTIHFHLLTNNRMNIQDVNKAMANSINTEVKKGNMSWKNSNPQNYNGVDVDSPQYPKRRKNETRQQHREKLNRAKKIDKNKISNWIGGYLTKYLTKNDIIFERLPWHCSRDISALFTSIVIADHEIEWYINNLPDESKFYKIINKDNITINIFLFNAPETMFADLDRANQMIFHFVNDKLIE